MDYLYQCLDLSGKRISGSIAAKDLSDAKALLRERKLTVLEIVSKEATGQRQYFLRKKISDGDIYSMTRELSILLKSGIRIDRAFEILLGSVSNIRLRENLSLILTDIKAGKPLAQAFADTKKFSPLITTMLEAGESVGDIKSAFENIAQHTNFQIKFRDEIKNALTYPLFLIFASIFTLFVIFKFIIPRFFSIFGKESASLPLPAKMLYTIGNALNFANIYILAGVLVILLLAVKSRTIDLRPLFSKGYDALLFIPLLRNLVIYLEMSRFCYSMFSMLNSGIEFIHALKLSTGIIQHKLIKTSLGPAIDQIREGKGIAAVFSQISFLPELVPNMLRVGEESGNLKEIFLELHEVFDERFKNSIKKLLVLVEPMVITVTGIIVGFIVISLILTVMSVGNIKF